MISKPGYDNIVLSERVGSMAQWKNIEQVLGLEVETIVGKARGRRGKDLSPEAWSHRLNIAREMIRLGFPSTYVGRHVGLTTLRRNGFDLEAIDALSNEEIIQRYGGTKRGRTTVSTESLRHIVGIRAVPEVTTLEWEPPVVRTAETAAEVESLPEPEPAPDEQPTEHEREVAVAVAQGDIGAVLELLVELHADIRAANVDRERAAELAQRIRTARAQAERVRDAANNLVIALRDLISTLGSEGL